MECPVCYDDLTDENSLEYQIFGDANQWFPCHFCEFCILALQSIQFQKYCADLMNSTCAREQRALLERGPPINVHDKNGFPMAGSNEIAKLRRKCNKEVRIFSFHSNEDILFVRNYQQN